MSGPRLSGCVTLHGSLTDRGKVGREWMQVEPPPGLHDLARRIVADQRRQALRCVDERAQIDACVVAHQFERVHDLLAAYVAAGARRIGTPPDAAQRRVEAV